MKGRTFLCVLLMPLITSVVFAADAPSVSPFIDGVWVSTLSLGPAWERAGQTQSFYLKPDIEKSYVANKATNSFLVGEFFVGKQNRLSASLLAQWGLAFAATGDASLSGIIWDDADSRFANYRYQYNIEHRHVAMKTKLLIDQGLWLTPWLSASLGLGFNTAHDYQNTPLIYPAVENANFASYTQMAITYTLGVGVQRPLNEHWLMGLGYQFADWGKSRLGRAAGQSLNNGLALNHLYTNDILFDLSYCS